jgi:SAM-dependent methyltransferase
MMQIHRFTNGPDFLNFLTHSPEFGEQSQYELAIARRHQNETVFHLDGYCKVCEKPTLFQVDHISASEPNQEGFIVPNWRERLLCECELNNRQRAMLHQVKLAVQNFSPAIASKPLIYAMEQVTPLYQTLVRLFPNAQCIGSEFVDEKYASGTIINGIRHENAEDLSFADDQLNLVISNDVLEHVNDPQKALAEIFRVLAPGGELFLTIPFHITTEETVRRAEYKTGQLIHYLPAQYHGNPMSNEGSLVFHDFGWDFLKQMQNIGFESAALCLYWSCFYGYLGAPLSYFYARKPL